LIIDYYFYAIIGYILKKPTPFPGPRPGLSRLVSYKAIGANSISLLIVLKKNRKNGYYYTNKRTVKNGSSSKYLN
ncbi:hypothetical protein CCUS01_14049, partial [Colletotrichum cuscutae]